MTGKRKRYGADFKAKVALEALRGELPSVPTMMRHRPAGSLDPKARKDCLSHAHVTDTH